MLHLDRTFAGLRSAPARRIPFISWRTTGAGAEGSNPATGCACEMAEYSVVCGDPMEAIDYYA